MTSWCSKLSSMPNAPWIMFYHMLQRTAAFFKLWLPSLLEKIWSRNTFLDHIWIFSCCVLWNQTPHVSAFRPLPLDFARCIGAEAAPCCLGNSFHCLTLDFVASVNNLMVQYDGAIIINMTAWWAAKKPTHTFTVLLRCNVPLVFNHRADETRSPLPLFVSLNHLETKAALKAL